jgi:hypothetical protein
MENFMLLQTPLNGLRHALEQRGVLGHLIKLKGLIHMSCLSEPSKPSGCK